MCFVLRYRRAIRRQPICARAGLVYWTGRPISDRKRQHGVVQRLANHYDRNQHQSKRGQPLIRPKTQSQTAICPNEMAHLTIDSIELHVVSLNFGTAKLMLLYHGRNQLNTDVAGLHVALPYRPRWYARYDCRCWDLRQDNGASAHDCATANPNTWPDKCARSNPAFRFYGDRGRD